jgi:hypothetical protein
MARKNLVPNPSFEVNTTGWTADFNATIARSTAQAYAGAASLALTAVTANGGMYARTTNGTSGLPVVGGATYTIQLRSRAAATARNIGIGYSWYNAAGGQVGTNAFPGGPLNSTSGWTQHSQTVTAPASAAFLTVWVFSPAAAAGEVHYIDAVMVEAAPSAGSYFDGATPDAGGVDYAWTGTAHASASTASRVLSSNATDAAAAKAMVDRMRAALIVDATGAFAATYNTPHDLCDADRWKAKALADSAAGTFTFWGLGLSQVIVKHTATGALYKVLRDASKTSLYTAEKNVFNEAQAAGRAWCPAFALYDSVSVMALAEYTPLVDPMPGGQFAAGVANSVVALTATQLASPEISDLRAQRVFFGHQEIALDGPNIVLIDGTRGAGAGVS